jgi:hypothetical protein
MRCDGQVLQSMSHCVLCVCVVLVQAKSLSKDLQRKLLAGTPLQRELGRVTQRLEEVRSHCLSCRVPLAPIDLIVLACLFTVRFAL